MIKYISTPPAAVLVSPRRKRKRLPRKERRAKKLAAAACPSQEYSPISHRQVFWLRFPGRRSLSAIANGYAAHSPYSGGTAPASHRIPYYALQIFI